MSRLLSFPKKCWDLKVVICYILTNLILFMCGIILCILTDTNITLQKYAYNFVQNAINIKMETYYLGNIIQFIVYGYIIYFIAKVRSRKYYCALVLAFKNFFSGYYFYLIVCQNFIGVLVGIIIYFFVYIVFLFLILCIVIYSDKIKGNISYLLPSIFAITLLMFMVIWIEVIFRFIILFV